MSNLHKLLTLIKNLRDPKTGCPWTFEQTLETLAPQTVEESYELADAIESGNPTAIKDELGDLLYHIVFYASIAEKEGLFNFDDVAAVTIIKDKARRAQDDRSQFSAEDIKTEWEKRKHKERKAKAATGSLLDDVVTALPALTRAVKLQNRAALVGFDWKELSPIIDKLHEELAELQTEVEQNAQDKIQEELGDLLFVCTNLARHLDVDPETALRQTNRKFTKRFQFIEKRLKEQGKAIEDATLEEMEVLWEKAKKELAADGRR